MGTWRTIACLYFAALILGCATGRWVQSGKTDLDSQQEYKSCRQEVIDVSGSFTTFGNFAAGAEIRDCMRRRGYQYIKSE